MIATRNVGRMSHSPDGGKTNTYLTPKLLLALVYECLEKVDLDPCSNSHAWPQVCADAYYTEAENGLLHQWRERIFANPPYKAVRLWAQKFLDEYALGHMTEGILLVAASTETRWYQQLGRSDALICHINERLWFDQAPGIPCKERARFGSVLFYLGQRQERFKEVFEKVGFVR